MTPIIGITATLKEDEEQVAPRPLGSYVRMDLDYVEGVSQAGGAPVVLPPVEDLGVVEHLSRGLDGLLLSGGSDLQPGYYGEEPLPEMNAAVPERDAFEIALAESALRQGLPVFGICRGLQVLNVALGGTLYQDIPSQLGIEMLKHRQEFPKWKPTHEVEVHEDSGLAGIMGASSALKVNSYHHQAIKDLAGELEVSARSSDGVVEGAESRSFPGRWLLGVQWHAEAMRDSGPEHRKLFEAHVAAAEQYSGRRAAA